MAGLAAILAAVAASIGAGLTALNLYVTGRRDTKKWVREALIESYVSYLNASFEQSSASRRLISARRSRVFEKELQALVVRIEAGRRTQNDVLTRLRLLATAEVVAAAEELLLANRAAAEVALDLTRIPSVEAWDAPRELLKIARERLVDAARRSIHLPLGKPIDSRLAAWPVPPPPGLFEVFDSALADKQFAEHARNEQAERSIERQEDPGRTGTGAS